ncbi:hypothetical protein DFJ74DRAFT_721161 [Hyaloraphidium curvatum]|nr:hypothetical protein DFJ74DRAFT_721161 [Hyaloraphidium curvatum]
MLLALVLLLSFLAAARAHVEVRSPLPRGSRYGNPPIDYDLKSPLAADRPWPCGGKPPGQVVHDVAPGQSLAISFEGSALHNGGHCQFAISPIVGSDVLKTTNDWVVLRTIVRTCFLDGMSYSVTLPGGLGGRWVISWNWINAIGAREYYENCIDIRFPGSTTSGAVTGPQLLLAQPDLNPWPAALLPVPRISEFNFPYEVSNAGIEYLEGRAVIRVDAGGGVVTVVPGSTPTANPGPTTPTTSTSGPTTTSTSAAGATCTDGTYLCGTGGSTSDARAFRQCANGVYVLLSCPPNTVCIQTGSQIACGAGIPGTSTSSSTTSSRTTTSSATTTRPTTSTSTSATTRTTTTSAASGPCAAGSYRCAGTGFEQCANGVWVAQPCPAGTKCYAGQGTVWCGAA